MDILQIQKYTLNPNIIIKRIDNVLMVYNKENGDMYEINEVGGDIFSCLQKQQPLAAILEYLLDNYDVSRDLAIEEMEEFVRRLIEVGVLII